ncbi:TRM11 family methyltransferase [Niallia sp. NCCP-28]|uniref:TRM11 family SAM-dependent methyltransferase n=1 Tax=Niallia sp. NCCP-28 TaxID=2934712 RepID=UPI00208CCD94|nr:RsmD family RNA methyltransferase [Niallia sp. NCCP-28]GKU82173.1 methyltransferase [Niallia sp. NCCP-28]
MVNQSNQYLYTYSYHEDEEALCRMEMRSLFGFDTSSFVLESTKEINLGRSPFIKEKIDIICRGKEIEDILQQVSDLPVNAATLKVLFIENPDKKKKISFAERKKIAKEVGLQLKGKVDLVQPQLFFAIMPVENGWIFGQYKKSESVWLKTQQKPHQYSTALSTKVARTIVNIAVPDINGVKAIDPCCGIGTVLIEALSMGIDIVGSDNNPLVTGSARENIAHFGYKGEVLLKDMRDIQEYYDTAIIDMPYNLCSVLPRETQMEMLASARRFAKKVIIITIEIIDSYIEEAGFIIKDRCMAKKGSFSRQVLICE